MNNLSTESQFYCHYEQSRDE